jgi:hypothetical protein
MLIQVLAILSAAAAGGMRIGLPLLVIGLVHLDKLWSDIPLLSYLQPQVVVAILTSWSLFELFATKKLMGLRIIQIIQLVFSPIAGALLAIGVAKLIETDLSPLWLIGISGGSLALILKFVQVGWFFRLKGIPMPFIIAEDLLSVFLVLFALKAPENGGLIAMLLLWIALRSSTQWRNWYQEKKILSPSTPANT